MNVSHPVADKIVARIRRRNGTPVAIADLQDLAARPAINQALTRLTRQGRIQRVGRGLYAWPRFSALLNDTVSPDVDALAHAWARRNGLRIVPFGAHAANLLGLSTQVPAKYAYYTNGRTQQVRLGRAVVKFLNRGPKTMEVNGPLAAHIVQALRHLGKGRVAPRDVARLRRLIRDRDRDDLRRALKSATGWMRPILQDIIKEDPP
jgi:hypothetical protein